MSILNWKSKLNKFSLETVDLNIYLVTAYLRLSSLEQWSQPLTKTLFPNPILLVLTGSVTYATTETKCSWGEFTRRQVSWHIKEQLKTLCSAVGFLTPRKHYKLRAWRYHETQAGTTETGADWDIVFKKVTNTIVSTIGACKIFVITKTVMLHDSRRVTNTVKEKNLIKSRYVLTYLKTRPSLRVWMVIIQVDYN